MRGETSVISVMLLLLVTVLLISFLYIWLIGYATSITSMIELSDKIVYMDAYSVTISGSNVVLKMYLRTSYGSATITHIYVKAGQEVVFSANVNWRITTSVTEKSICFPRKGDIYTVILVVKEGFKNSYMIKI